MSRRLIVSDVHGDYQAMIDALLQAKYKPDSDSLICLGDMINRGPRSAEVINFMRTYASIVLLGNHETGLPLWIGKQIPDEFFFSMGGEATIQSYMRIENGEEVLADDMAWLWNLPVMHEDDDYIYVHASLDKNRPLHAQNVEATLWGQATGFYRQPHPFGKTIVHGHVPVKNLYQMNKMPFTEQRVFKKDGKIGVDGGSQILADGHVYVYDIDNDVTYSALAEGL